MNLEKLIADAVDRATEPLREQAERQQAMLSSQAAADAMEGLRAALEVYCPSQAHRADDPAFVARFRDMAIGLPAEALSNPQMVASAALGLLAYSGPSSPSAPVYGVRPAHRLDTPRRAPQPQEPEEDPLDAVDPRFQTASGGYLHTLDAYLAAMNRAAARKKE